ncbi:amidohydrolase family protein [Streptomyces sp. NPDC059639]|uniref:amidohydrolase family protein n=1 Tax=Streptomyces sp. NPDC059639 TaxID=3346891 RepID=UPI0036759217
MSCAPDLVPVLRDATGEQYARAAELGATVSLFMDHVRWWGDVLADDLYGPEVAARWMSARTAWDHGHRVSLHNDGVCTPAEPLSSVATAVTRRSTSGRVHGADQALTVEEALRAVTVNAAWQLHMEDHIGMLRPGMRADFAVLNQDPHTVPADRLREDMHVTGTFLSGRRTWWTRNCPGPSLRARPRNRAGATIASPS